MIVTIIELSDDGKEEFVGSGFIIESGLLITAGHTFFEGNEKKSSTFYARVNDICFKLSNSLHDEYLKKEIGYNKHDVTYYDLYVFKVPENIGVHSELRLSNNIDFNMSVDLVGFCTSETEFNKKEGIILNHRESVTNISFYDSNIRTFKNCFRVDVTVEHKMSGGPVLKGNDVLGMIVFGFPGTGTTAIKSSHIIEILSTL